MAKEVRVQDIKFGNQAAIDAFDFGTAFKHARLRAGGAGGKFTWRGKQFTTDYAEEDWSPTYPGKKRKVGGVPSQVSSPVQESSTSTLDQPIDEVMSTDDFEDRTSSTPISSTPTETQTGLSTDKKIALAVGTGLGLSALWNRRMFQSGDGRGRAPRLSYEELMGPNAPKNTISPGPSRYPLTVFKSKTGFTMGEGATEYTGPTRVRPQMDLVHLAGPINVHEDMISLPARTIGSPMTVVKPVYEGPREIGYTKPAGLLGPGKIKRKRSPRRRK